MGEVIQENVEDIYHLSPLQEGLLFHSLSGPESGFYFNQVIFTLQGNLDVAAFRRAWQQVVDRHPALRTCFVWERQARPLQVVRRRVSVPLEQQDWRGLSPSEQQTRLDAMRRADLQRGFDLSRAPLMRLGLSQTEDDSHEFLWSHHHILIDGWSMFLVLREVFAFYDAFSSDRELELECPRPYREYIVWLKEQELSRAEAFWRKTLKGFTAPTPLVVDRASGSRYASGVDFDVQQLQLEAGATAALQSLARQHRLTLNTLVQGAWALLLSRYCGEGDVVFGTVVSGRSASLAGAESMVGLFINTLPTRVKVPPGDSVLNWLQQLQAEQVELREYQQSRLVDIQSWSDVPRGGPLFESILGFENYRKDVPVEKMSQCLFIRNARWFERTSDPLVANAVAAEELSLRIVYHTTRFDAPTIARMLGHWGTLLQGIAADPGCKLSDLPLLTATERRQLLGAWNATSADYPTDRCVHELFEAQVDRIPDALAGVCEDKQLTYGQLNRRANQLAHHLRARGVGPEVLVGICMERSLELLIGVLGTLKAGGAYVPLDPAYPKERLAFMLEDTGAPVLLTQHRLIEALPDSKAYRICLDTDWGIIAHESEQNPVAWTSPQNLAYVIYTSGSTGKPKGVEIPHAGLMNLIMWHRRVYDVTPTDRATQVAAPAFDACVWELWPYLTAGASIHIPDEEIVASPSALLEWLRSQAVTMCFLPTPLAEAVLEEQWPTDLALRILLTGGDKLRRRPRSALPVYLANNYGPTENTVVTTWTPIAPQADTDRPPPIGRPIANTKVYVLDRHMQPVPIGVPGQLYIAGAGLARAYLNRPDLTAERFTPDPFGEEFGVRLYGTGDLVRYLPDGNLEFLGRNDHQVKIRGFRIELGEIEAILGRHPAVRQAVVSAREDVPGEKRLVAYVVSNHEPLSIGELHRFLSEQLPEYMVPHSFIILGTLPLTLNGKVDRSALPAPPERRPDSGTNYVKPQTEIECTIASIWQEVLRVEKVGLHDNFFELGGDSILSIQIVAKANRAGLRFTTKQIFQHQTVAELAAVAGPARVTEAEQSRATGAVPLTPIQHWFFEENFAEPNHFNLPMMLEVRKSLDLPLLERAVQQVVMLHDALRLRFISDGSGWRQFHAAAEEAVAVTRTDLSGLPAAQQARAIESRAAELQAGLGLSEGPIVRVALFDLGHDTPSRLLIVIHHLVVDIVSWRILLEDLQTALDQLGRGEAVQLPLKTASFKHWAERLTERAQSKPLAAELGYWLSLPWTRIRPLPVDHAEGANTTASARTISVSLSAEETRSLLHDVPRAYNSQINDVLLTALARSVSQWAGTQSVLIHLESHGREDIFEDVNLSRTVGWFTTLFPVLISLEAGTSHPADNVKATKEQLRRIPNRGIGYGLLRYLSGNKQTAERLRALPRPEVSFQYLGQFDRVLPDSSPFALSQSPSGSPISLRGNRSYLLEVIGLVTEGRLRIDWIYSENVHDHATVRSLAQSFLDSLRLVLAHGQSIGSRGYMPTDFPEAGLSQRGLDKLIDKINQAGRRRSAN